MKFDAKFHAFQEISKLVDLLFPNGYQLTKDALDAIHACAKKLADDLTNGDYERAPLRQPQQTTARSEQWTK
jgi:hypothetical protein